MILKEISQEETNLESLKDDLRGDCSLSASPPKGPGLLAI